MKKYIYITMFFLCTSILIFLSLNRNKSVFVDKKLNIKFEVPLNWQKQYKIIKVKNKDNYDKIVFKTEIKDQDVILMELWVLSKKSWECNKDVRKLIKVEEYDNKIYAYSRLKLESIIENLGEDIKKEEMSCKSEIINKYIDESDLKKRIYIIKKN